ncbi:MAG TPA: alpha/beta hydrolase-fold protein [Polyangiaceae bacterium]|nr:alpha/beta hydrolase-fold protein [Polyangiaceae bacterium]
MVTRRRWLASAFSLLASSAAVARGAKTTSLSAREITLATPGRFGQKCLLLRPARVSESEALPLLVLFHGLGETGSEALGIRAWYDRYGLPEAYARLSSPPIERTLPAERYLSDERLLELNRELSARPFPDLALVCPFTPNVFKQHPSAPFLDRYAEYIEQSLLPAVRAATPILASEECCGVAGVSLGGYVALEVFLRKSALFSALSCVQPAISAAAVETYATRLASWTSNRQSGGLGPRIQLVSSSYDPFRAATQRLAKRLTALGSNGTSMFPAGPHDQRFLREVGTLEMLLFQARALHGSVEP